MQDARSNASDGATGTLYAKVTAVSFDQDSASQNTIRFKAADMVGNTGTQASATAIKVDTTPPNSFSIYSPTGPVVSLTPTVIVQFTVDLSGLNVSTVQFAFSSSGSNDTNELGFG